MTFTGIRIFNPRQLGICNTWDSGIIMTSHHEHGRLMLKLLSAIICIYIHLTLSSPVPGFCRNLTIPNRISGPHPSSSKQIISHLLVEPLSPTNTRVIVIRPANRHVKIQSRTRFACIQPTNYPMHSWVKRDARSGPAVQRPSPIPSLSATGDSDVLALDVEEPQVSLSQL